jgi:fermentation-respiration switch protein FrsA (DUF1100 family)
MRQALLGVLLLAGTVAVGQQDIAGVWEGQLRGGRKELRTVIHIYEAPGGGYKATIDSPDEKINGIPATSVMAKDGKVVLASDVIDVLLEAALSSDGSTLNGTWTQRGGKLPLSLKRVPGVAQQPEPTPTTDIDGTWGGTLQVGAISLRVVFHIFSAAGVLRATMDSPDQGAKAMPVSAVTRDGASLKLEVKVVNGAFQGTIKDGASSISGTWMQGGSSLPLVLKRVMSAAASESKGPQEPKKPFPYHEQEVSYRNPLAKNTLSGTLTIPTGEGPFPAVLLINGSGQQDRDESILGHKPFLVMADYLTRRGIAVLRVDDRGTGKSTGDVEHATTADFASDAEASLLFLKSRPEVNTRKIGIVGHSEGGMIAPMIAARSTDVAFIVMMAGTAVPGDQVLYEQVRLGNQAAGVPGDKIAETIAQEREILGLVKNTKDDIELEKQLRAKIAGKIPENQVELQIRALKSPWFRYFLGYDPATALRKVTVPVLAINGSKDTQVSAAQNLPVIRKSLTTAGNRDHEEVELPGLNHLFQTAKTGSPAEYAQIEETISPMALEKVGDWIVAHTTQNSQNR